MNVEQIWREYKSMLFGVLRSKINNENDAEDLLQEILIKVHTNLAQLKDHRSIKPWLLQICHNAIVDYYRRRARKAPQFEKDLWQLEQEYDGKKTLDEGLLQCITPFIANLSEDNQRLLTDIELLGNSQKTYANLHNIPYSTLKSRVKKARQELKSEFEKCCRFDYDTRGSVMDYQQKDSSRGKC